MMCLPKKFPAAIVLPKDGALQVGPNRVTILREAWTADGCLLESAATGMVAYDVAPGYVAPPVLHWHTREDWTATVLGGRLAVRFADRREIVGRGASLIVPAGCPFAWYNPDDAPARIIFSFSPGGFENYYREVVPLIDAHPGLAVADLTPKLKPLWAKYGLESFSRD
jgi:quercetin dioxygenase-like cupin family protein